MLKYNNLFCHLNRTHHITEMWIGEARLSEEWKLSRQGMLMLLYCHLRALSYSRNWKVVFSLHFIKYLYSGCHKTYLNIVIMGMEVDRNRNCTYSAHSPLLEHERARRHISTSIFFLVPKFFPISFFLTLKIFLKIVIHIFRLLFSWKVLFPWFSYSFLLTSSCSDLAIHWKEYLICLKVNGETGSDCSLLLFFVVLFLLCIFRIFWYFVCYAICSTWLYIDYEMRFLVPFQNPAIQVQEWICSQATQPSNLILWLRLCLTHTSHKLKGKEHSEKLHRGEFFLSIIISELWLIIFPWFLTPCFYDTD